MRRFCGAAWDVLRRSVLAQIDVLEGEELGRRALRQRRQIPSLSIAARYSSGDMPMHVQCGHDCHAHYVSSYASPEQLRAGLEFYRAYPANERFNTGQRGPIDVPIVLAGGEHSLAPINPTVAGSLREHGWRYVSVKVIANSGHQVIDEQPAIVAELLERYAVR